MGGDGANPRTQRDPWLSLQLIAEVSPTGSVIDVGGGASPLASRLLDARHAAVAVLDVAPAAVERAKQRMGSRAALVRWIVADVTTTDDVGAFDVLHDRAAFHLLTLPSDRERYVGLLRKTVPVPETHLTPWGKPQSFQYALFERVVESRGTPSEEIRNVPV